MASLTFAHFREVNVARCTEGWQHALDGWDESDWLIAIGGELGEALNVVKKLNRERDHIVGNSRSAGELHQDLADELADTVIYLDLHLAHSGERFFDGAEDLPDFAAMAALERLTFPLHGLSYAGRRAMEFAGHLANAQSLASANRLLYGLQSIARAAEIDLGAAIVSKFNRTSEKRGFPHRLTA